MITSFDIIKALVRTEKSTLQEPFRKYYFLVAKNANKVQIKEAIEDIYKVLVADVNTYIIRGKMKAVRHQKGKTPDFKRAVVTLQEGHKIDLT